MGTVGDLSSIWAELFLEGNMPRKILPPLDWQIGEDEPKAEGLKKRLLSFIGKGMLPEGTRLPSVRQMTASSGVSKNTVERVYAELKDEGVIAVRPGSGFGWQRDFRSSVRQRSGLSRRKTTMSICRLLRPQRKRLTLFPFSGVTPVGLFPAAVP